MFACNASGGDGRRRQSIRAIPRCERGALTLVELLVVGAMLVVTVPIAGLFMVNVINRTDDTQARTQTLAAEQVAIDRMAREIRQASALTIGDGTGDQGNTIDVETPNGRFLWDCSGDVCTRAELIDGAFGTPATELEDLAPSSDVFTARTTSGGATVLIKLGVRPDGRARDIVLRREVSLRNA